MKQSYFMEVLKFLAEFKWPYLAYVLPVFIFFLIVYLRYKKYIFENASRFIQWIRPSFETNGKASTEKLLAFSISIGAYIPGRTMFSLNSNDPVHQLWALGIDALFICVLIRIISPQQLIELKNGTIDRTQDTQTTTTIHEESKQ